MSAFGMSRAIDRQKQNAGCVSSPTLRISIDGRTGIPRPSSCSNDRVPWIVCETHIVASSRRRPKKCIADAGFSPMTSRRRKKIRQMPKPHNHHPFHVTSRDVESLKRNQEIRINVLNVWIQHVIRPRFREERILLVIRNPKQLRVALSDVTRRPLRRQRVFIPIVYRRHALLLVLLLGSGVMLFADSLSPSGKRPAISRECLRLIRNFCSTMRNIHSPRQEIDTTGFGNNCGIHVLMNLEYLLEHPQLLKSPPSGSLSLSETDLGNRVSRPEMLQRRILIRLFP